ncbi:hypothetical protein STENM223S_11567 [Streptomyces tendae]
MGAIGIKTGSTTAAGGNLLFAARKEVGGETVTVVGAILGQHKPKILETANKVSRTALTAAQDALTSAKILKRRRRRIRGRQARRPHPGRHHQGRHGGRLGRA